jgi:hypothetical protein
VKRKYKYLLGAFGIIVVGLLIAGIFKFEIYPQQEVLFRSYTISQGELKTTEFISPYNNFYGYDFSMRSGNFGVRIVWSDEIDRYNLLKTLFTIVVWNKNFTTNPPFLDPWTFSRVENGCPSDAICLDAEKLSEAQKQFLVGMGFSYQEYRQQRWVCNGACHYELVKLWKFYYKQRGGVWNDVVSNLKNYECKFYFADRNVDCQPIVYSGYDLRWIVNIPQNSPKADGKTIYLIQKLYPTQTTSTTTTIQSQTTTTTTITINYQQTTTTIVSNLDSGNLVKTERNILDVILEWLRGLLNWFFS